MQYRDSEFGLVSIARNARARAYTIRVRDGELAATMPARGSLEMMIEFINREREKIRKILSRPTVKKKLLDETSNLQTNTFRLEIRRVDRQNFYMSLKEGVLYIACPADTDFGKPEVQALLKQFLVKALRHEAKRVLPVRLRTLAQKHGFSYEGLRIADTKTRWGSCSSLGNINLSLSLMLLPDHLLNYVILHELCHTKEMNHSPRFWALMNGVTDNLALSLRKELKTYSTLG